MSGAERLREAARVLRGRAEAAGEQASTLSDHKTGTSLDSLPPVTWYGDGADWRDPECRYIATMHPGVGLALADWLDAAADFHDDKPHGYDCQGCGAESVADAILGGAS